MPGGDEQRAIAEEAARIVCSELVIDYRTAKARAVHRLGLPPRTGQPDNALVQQAVIDYQRLFGGEAYRQRLRAMRDAALEAMRLFAAFNPRLVGAAVSGAVTAAHRTQLHVFADSTKSVDIELHNRRIPFEPDERQYRYSGGRAEAVPLIRLQLPGGEGVDVAVFGVDDLRRAPINPFDGKPYRRLDADQVRALRDQA